MPQGRHVKVLGRGTAALLAVVEETGLDGVIATNTTIRRTGLATDAARVEAWYIAELAKTFTLKTVALVGAGGILLGILLRSIF